SHVLEVVQEHLGVGADRDFRAEVLAFFASVHGLEAQGSAGYVAGEGELESGHTIGRGVPGALHAVVAAGLVEVQANAATPERVPRAVAASGIAFHPVR